MPTYAHARPQGQAQGQGPRQGEGFEEENNLENSNIKQHILNKKNYSHRFSMSSRGIQAEHVLYNEWFAIKYPENRGYKSPDPSGEGKK